MGALRSWLVALLVLAVHGLAVAAALVSEPVVAPQLQTSAPLYGALVSAPAAQGQADEKTPDTDAPETEPEPEREAESEPEPLAEAEPALPAPAPEPVLETAVTEKAADQGEQADPAETGPASDGNNQPTVIPPRIDARARQNTPPAYPALSRRRGEEGTVLLAIRIDPHGRVVQAQVAESSGFRRLDEAALTAVRRWHYQPATRAGVAIAWEYRQPVVFSLAD